MLLLQIVSFAKILKHGKKKNGGKANVCGDAPTHAPIRERRNTRKSANIREPYTTKFEYADKGTSGN